MSLIAIVGLGLAIYCFYMAHKGFKEYKQNKEVKTKTKILRKNIKKTSRNKNSKFCIECGNKVQRGVKFCEQCGEKQ